MKVSIGAALIFTLCFFALKECERMIGFESTIIGAVSLIIAILVSKSVNESFKKQSPS